MMAVRGPSLVEVEILLAPAGKRSLCANTIQTSETLPATIALAQSRRNGFAIDIRAHPLPGGMPSVPPSVIAFLRERYRRFESGFLQQRVGHEPHGQNRTRSRPEPKFRIQLSSAGSPLRTRFGRRRLCR